MSPIQAVTAIASSTYRLLSRAHSSTGTKVAARMMRPPIVGVLPFPACVSGVPSRTTWCTAMARSRRIMTGPKTNVSSSADTNAAADRKVM